MSDIEGVTALLESPYFPGVGKVYAEKITRSLGERLLDLETLEAKDFLSVEGIGEKLATNVENAAKVLPASPSFLIFLFSSGLSYTDIKKIISKYGKDSEKIVRENPYDMVEDVWKFSFFKADKIGEKSGVEKADPRRLRGALLTAVKLIAEQGSLFASREELVKKASLLTGVAEDKFPEQISHLISEERLVESLGGIYLPVYYNAEVETASKIASIIKDRSGTLEVEFDLPKEDLEGHIFTNEQINAIKMVRDNPVSIITGDPGTGKTTTVRGLIKLFEDEGKRVILTAPTGRSTKKLETTAGSTAKTMHRILGFRRGKGYFTKKLDADVLIIDEASLLEQVLFNHLLQALPPKIKIVLVGDVGQLPPIGAGKVLEDLISSGEVPVARLSHNFRQEQGSVLAGNIQKIKNGLMPEASENGDFSIITGSDDKDIKEKILEVVTNVLPTKYGVNPSDIQVVSPQHDGELGVASLNESLQQILQNESPQISRGNKKFRLGDRVVQSENSARRGVYNGETGKIVDLNTDKRVLTVDFGEGKMSEYSLHELGELSLAYATSVHKLQGIETDFIVMPLTRDHERMLYRNLLLTAVSRCRRHCVLVTEPGVLKEAVEKTAPYSRNSNLKVRLQNLLSSDSPDKSE